MTLILCPIRGHVNLAKFYQNWTSNGTAAGTVSSGVAINAILDHSRLLRSDSVVITACKLIRAKFSEPFYNKQTAIRQYIDVERMLSWIPQFKVYPNVYEWFTTARLCDVIADDILNF